MRRFFRRLNHRDAVMKNLEALLLLYPRGRQFARDFPELKPTIRADFDAGVPPTLSRIQNRQPCHRKFHRPARSPSESEGPRGAGRGRSRPLRRRRAEAGQRRARQGARPRPFRFAACRHCHLHRRAIGGGRDAPLGRLRGVPDADRGGARRLTEEPAAARTRLRALETKRAGPKPRPPSLSNRKKCQLPPPTQVSTLSGVQTSRPV